MAEAAKTDQVLKITDLRIESIHGLVLVDNVSLELRRGEVLGLIGESGAGKSTIVKLVARFYDVDAGRVLVDGVPVTQYDLGEFRRRLGYVPQEPFLFSGSVRDNIAYGRPDASDAEVERAARAVGAHEFVSHLVGGYLHPVTERARSSVRTRRHNIAAMSATPTAATAAHSTRTSMATPGVRKLPTVATVSNTFPIRPRADE